MPLKEPVSKKQSSATQPADGPISNNADKFISQHPGSESSCNEDPATSSCPEETGRGIGEVPPEHATKLLNAFDRFWGPLQDILDALQDFPDLANYRKQSLVMKETLEALKDLRKHEPTATIVPFSSLSWPKLERVVGVEVNRTDEDTHKATIVALRKHYVSLDKRRKAPQALFAPEKWNHQALKSELMAHSKSTINENEAGARTVIDIWTKPLAAYLEREDVLMVQMLEWRIQTSATRSNPSAKPFTVVKHQGNITALTGIADYAVLAHFNLKQTSVQVANEFATLRKYLKEKQEQGLYTFNDIEELVAKYRLILMEAKSLENTPLEKHIPQAIGECIPLAKKRKDVAFILTNGVEWIFGLVSATSSQADSSDDDSYEVIILPTMTIRPQDIQAPGPQKLGPEEISPSPYLVFLETLIAWIKFDPSEIHDIISPKMKCAAVPPERLGSKAKLKSVSPSCASSAS